MAVVTVENKLWYVVLFPYPRRSNPKPASLKKDDLDYDHFRCRRMIDS